MIHISYYAHLNVVIIINNTLIIIKYNYPDSQSFWSFYSKKSCQTYLQQKHDVFSKHPMAPVGFITKKQLLIERNINTPSVHTGDRCTEKRKDGEKQRCSTRTVRCFYGEAVERFA